MEKQILPNFEEAQNESAELDFKASFDPAAPQDWCEIIKDLVAMANSGGGLIVIGVNDDGSPASADLQNVLALDPATIADKIKKYTDQHVAGFSLSGGLRYSCPVAMLSVSPVPIPIVFTAPGTYDVGGGKQKTAFSKGTVYFRHGPKSEPGTSEDLRAAINRELDRIRSSWLDGIKKVVTAPIGSTISVLPAEVKLSGANGAAVRLVTDENAPAFKAVRTDLLYPYRQKELVARVKQLLGDSVITGHDVLCVRKAHRVDSEPNFFYKPQYSSPQYSEAFAHWMIEQFRADPEFFDKAREACKKHEASR
ncbi:MAG TPA: ATP-binding protein [Fimbriiglobus sp.]|nr:ATP-binding protein [Fimbriiglobus sp.]